MPNPKPTVFFAVLCDDVRQEADGKSSLMGLFNNFNVSDYKQPLSTFTIHVRFGFKEEGRYTVKFEIRSHKGDFTIAMQSAIQPAPPKNAAYNEYNVSINAKVENLKIPREGRYSVNVKVDDHSVTKIPFTVTTPKSPIVQ